MDNVVTLVDRESDERHAKLGITQQAEDLNNLAVHLKRDRHYHAAVIAMRRAVALCPESGFLWNGLGSVLWNLGRYDEAHSASSRALQLLGDEPGLMMNMGMLLSSLRQVDLALDYLKRTVDKLPDDPHARWSYALGLLDHGRWKEGFEQYDCRIAFRGPKFYPKMPYPRWEGQSLDGKTLYVQAEQGLGDRILFSRYLAWVKEAWPTCHVKALMSSHDQIDLEGILWGYHDKFGIEFLHHGTPWPKADYGIFLMSIPRIHGTTLDDVPPDPWLIRDRCLEESKAIDVPAPLTRAIKVGISWAGNPIMDRNHERSIPPELLFELEADPKVQLYSLQFGDNGLHRLNASQIICDAASDIGDRGLLGTGAVMMNLDLVITCCTANAHLAGSLNVPCWTLLCYDPYWTWVRDRDDSVWYPSMRLFRQRAPGDWRELIDRVKRELSIFAHAKLTQEGMTHGQCIG
jgi:Tetratricopeptide repeat